MIVEMKGKKSLSNLAKNNKKILLEKVANIGTKSNVIKYARIIILNAPYLKNIFYRLHLHDQF
jgi:hypothetical protein